MNSAMSSIACPDVKYFRLSIEVPLNKIFTIIKVDDVLTQSVSNLHRIVDHKE